jgi:hypothetical protein
MRNALCISVAMLYIFLCHLSTAQTPTATSVAPPSMPPLRTSATSPATLGNVRQSICEMPLVRLENSSSTISKSVWSWRRRSNKEELALSQSFDMTKSTCVPKSYDLYVENEQPVTIDIQHWKDVTCSAVASYTDNPPRDYGAIIQGLLGTSVKSLAALGVTPSPEVQKITLPYLGVKNTAAAIVISCQIAKDKDTVPPTELGVQRKFTVHYGNVDLLSASTGAIVSSQGKRIYGVQTTQTGVSGGVATTQSAIAITASSKIQFVPIALVNFNYAGNKNYNWNAQLGLGINPNGSSTQVEYFASPIAFSIHNLYLSPGLHIARSERIINGFYVGDLVSSSTFTVPTKWQATYKFGFTVSYRPYK